MAGVLRVFWTLLVLLAAGYGSSKLAVSGIVDATLHEPGQPDVSASLPIEGEQTPVDAPPGLGSGLYGTCQQDGATWNFAIKVAGPAAGSVHGIQFTVTEGAAVAQVSFTVDAGTFQGTCSVASGAGTEGHSLPLSGHCPGLTIAHDPRTLDADVAMTVDHCTGS